MGQVAVFSGAQRRRRWSFDQKRALVAAAFAPGGCVAAVAQQADLAPGQIYRWRKELAAGAEPFGFAPVRVDGDRAPPPDGAITVKLGGAVVRISASAPPALVVAALKALR